MKSITIANGAGFWGDRPFVPLRMLKNGGFSVLTLEYLAELTMSILAAQKKVDPQMGYVKDFPEFIKKAIPYLQKGDYRIITNAGGLNPIACAKVVAKILQENGLGHLKIGIVNGDDVMPLLPQLAQKKNLKHLDTQKNIQPILSKIVAANAYLGAEGLVRCLNESADIIITGRIADGSLTLAPCMHAFGWSFTDYHQLSAGMIAGHLIECGAQVSGGNLSNRRHTKLNAVGYPMITMTENGDFTITKEKNTEGEISISSVSEQLVYEIGDPKHYLTPDVDCDFTSITLSQKSKDVVKVLGAKGRAPTPTFKVSIAYEAGYKTSHSLVVYGIDALSKAKECFEIIRHQIKEEKIAIEQLYPEYIGYGASVPVKHVSTKDCHEILLRISASAATREPLLAFLRLFTPLVTAGPAGVSGYTGGLPKPQKILGFWPALLEKNHIKTHSETRMAKDFL